MKRLLTEIIVALILIAAVGALYSLFKAERAEKLRFKKNQEVLMSDAQRWKTSDSLNVLQVGRLTLSNREFRNHNTSLMETVDKLKLKVRRLERASETGIVTNTVVKTIIKDSTVYRDKEPITLKCIDFDDGWLSANGCAENGMFNGTIVSRDTLQQFANRIPRKFLFLKYGTKGFSQIIVSSNPHTEISYHTEIIFKK